MIRITDKKLLEGSQISPDRRVAMIAELERFHHLDDSEPEPTIAEFEKADPWIWDNDFFVKKQDLKNLRSIMFPEE